DKPFVRAERRAMDAERRLLGVVAILVHEAETFRDGEIHLIGGDREFPAYGAPDLYVNLRAVERRFVGDLDVVDAARFEDLAYHVLGLLPQRRLVHVLLAEPFRRAGA